MTPERLPTQQRRHQDAAARTVEAPAPVPAGDPAAAELRADAAVLRGQISHADGKASWLTAAILPALAIAAPVLSITAKASPAAAIVGALGAAGLVAALAVLGAVSWPRIARRAPLTPAELVARAETHQDDPAAARLAAAEEAAALAAIEQRKYRLVRVAMLIAATGAAVILTAAVVYGATAL